MRFLNLVHLALVADTKLISGIKITPNLVLEVLNYVTDNVNKQQSCACT
jgi:hypothetical protein